MQAFECTKKPNILYFRFNEIVDHRHAEKTVNQFKAMMIPGQTYIAIIEFTPNTILTDKSFVEEIGHFAREHQDQFERSFYIGITGIRKILFQLYNKISKTKVERVLLDQIEEIQPILGVSVSNDFVKVFEWEADS